jgi:hypothetical protein
MSDVVFLSKGKQHQDTSKNLTVKETPVAK